MKPISSYFTKVSSVEETRDQRYQPPAKKPKKGPGRPKKNDPSPTTEPALPTSSEPAAMPSPAKPSPPVTIPDKFKCSYKKYNLAMKMQVIELADLHGQRVISRLFGIPKSTLGGWQHTLPNISGSTHCQKTGRKLGSGGKTPFTELDEELSAWVMNLRDLHLPVSVQLIKAEAIRRFKPKHPDFTASHGWSTRFLRRHNLTIRSKTSVAQKLPADLEDKKEAFLLNIAQLLEQDDFELIVNMDETPAFFDMLPSRTVAPAGSKQVIIRSTGSDKKHLTVVLAVSSDGDALPPMIIFKGVRPLKLETSSGTLVAVQKKAWMDEILMHRWIEEVLTPFTARRRTLLILDSFSAHMTPGTEKLLKKRNAVPIFIPGGCTSKLQPLDVSINKPFKNLLAECWAKFMLSSAEQLDLALAEDEDTAPVLKAATKQQMLNWVEVSWKQIGERRELISASFKICKLTGAISEEGVCELNRLFNDEEEEEEDFDGFDATDLEDPFEI